MTHSHYKFLIADDNIRQFAVRIEDDKVTSIAVFAENQADAVIRRNETVFARDDFNCFSPGIAEKKEGFDSKSGISLDTNIYKIEADGAGNVMSVTSAYCAYYSFGIVSEDLKTQEPRLIFSSTRHSAQELAKNGFGNSKAAFAVPLPQNMLPLARMEVDFDLSFDAFRKISLPKATLARRGIEELLLPKAAPDPIWIAPDNMTQTHNFSAITKRLRGYAP